MPRFYTGLLLYSGVAMPNKQNSQHSIARNKDNLVSWLLLLLAEEGPQGDTGHLDHLHKHTHRSGASIIQLIQFVPPRFPAVLCTEELGCKCNCKQPLDELPMPGSHQVYKVNAACNHN